MSLLVPLNLYFTKCMHLTRDLSLSKIARDLIRRYSYHQNSSNLGNYVFSYLVRDTSLAI